jgi:hypothetical protein
MQRAWSDLFRDLDETRPATTSRTVREEPATAEEARRTAVAKATAETPLVAAGLSARALSIALQQLEVATVGELIKIPATRIQRLRGVGLGPRNKLVKRAREWRQQPAVGEQVAEVAKAERDVTLVTDKGDPGSRHPAHMRVPVGRSGHSSPRGDADPAAQPDRHHDGDLHGGPAG